MNQFRRMQNILDGIKYKPGWEFQASPEPGMVSVHCIARVPDSRVESDDPYRPYVKVSSRWALYEDTMYNMSDEDLIKWIFHNIMGDLENHESREWFRVNGRLVYDPHEVQKLS